MIASVEECADYRYFVTYSGVRLPLKLVDPLPAAALRNRNTYYRARYDDAGRVILCERVVYGEVDLSHRYRYDVNGALEQAEILDADGELRVVKGGS